MALLIGIGFPAAAQVGRSGTQVQVWKSNLGPFDWKVNGLLQPDKSVLFHIVLTIKPTWPEVSLNHGPSATLSVAYFDPDNGYQIVKDLRPVALQIHGKSVEGDFAVTEEELKDPNLCFAFSLFKSERKERAEFALLNDFFDFPRSAVARLADSKATDRRAVAQKLEWASSMFHRDTAAWEKQVPNLIPYLYDHDRQVRESVLQALVTIRKPVDQIAPALIKILDNHARAVVREPSDEQIIRGLDEIDSRWYERPEVNGRVREYMSSFPKNLD
jgi:hypothetical protein